MGDAFPYVFGFGFGFEVGRQFVEVHVVDGLGPGGDDRAAEGGKGFLAERGVEGFVDKGSY